MAMQEGNLEEERRLCYVGITRAMKELVLTHAEIRRLYGNEVQNVPSRFLKEIPNNVLQPIRAGATQNGFQFPSASMSTSPSDLGGSSEGTGAFRLGQSVQHPRFGEGTILKFEGNGPNARIQVNFQGAGSKWLVAQYARLESV
jgi:DNA helicase-2/ATP-dependent DNA helicase PcrA